jgi:serine/threonine protein kinase
MILHAKEVSLSRLFQASGAHNRTGNLIYMQTKWRVWFVLHIRCPPLQGLDYLHANQVAHGDLKPDNLLLSACGKVKIADFGSSQLTRACSLVNKTCGTPAFMAPEMCGGHAYHAATADLWALGVCLFMFVYGEF